MRVDFKCGTILKTMKDRKLKSELSVDRFCGFKNKIIKLEGVENAIQT